MAMPVLYIAQPYTDIIRMLDVRATSYFSYIVIDMLHMYMQGLIQAIGVR